MKSYLQSLRYLISIHILGLFFFSLFRLVLLIQGFGYIDETSRKFGIIAEAFLRGVWMDNVVACYILLLPLVICSLSAVFNCYNRNIYRGINIFFCIFYGVAFTISAADIPYFDYFFKHINASIFNWFGYVGTTAGMMFGEASYLLAMAFLILMIALFCFLSKRILKLTVRDFSISHRRNTGIKTKSLIFICSALLIGACMFGIRGRTGYNPIRVSAAYYCNNTFLNQLGISPSFNLLRSSLEASKSENKGLELMDENAALGLVRKELGITDSIPEISPIARKIVAEKSPEHRNVVLVFMESMSAKLLNRYGNTENLTPTLDSLARQSLCFDRFYSAGTHTNHAIHSVLYSYPALMKRNSMKGAVIPFYAGLPTILQDNGYETLFFMTHESQYDNMNGFLRTNGFKQIYAQENYPREKVVNSFGVQDDFLYEYALDIFNQEFKTGKPFFGVLLSISNHPPYVIPKDFKSHSQTDEMRIVEFADHAIGEFMKKASSEPWFKNTIFVFVGDHGKKVGELKSDMPLSYNHVPCLFYSPGFITPQANDELGGQIDIAPTLLGMLNIDYTNNSFGIDLMREKRPYIFFTSDDAIGCINKNFFYINQPDNGQEWLLQVENSEEAGPSVQPALQDSMKSYAFSMLQAAQYLMKHELTGKYKGYIPE
ncbi:LTA synthase family protein [Coprobacter secundus]|uniref:LTA synthase family protein n=1 Tax=Coprobacter secundus TaxID=1501392 RepID=UPI000574318F|nr:phosphoglycerol transferase [Coprobacter secundus]